MTIAATREARPTRIPGPPLSLWLAFRELRGGVRGFYVFVSCIALGVAAIASVKNLAGALETAISREGQTLLGGDFDVSVIHRRATAEERAIVTAWGDVSEIATLRGMARREDGGGQMLVDVKAVDGAYPLFGAVKLEGGKSLAEAIAGDGIAIDASLAAQLQVGLGDRIALGQAEPRIAAIIQSEPDRVSGGAAFGPRILMSLATLAATGLDEPGSLIRWHYRVKLGDGETPARFRAEAEADLTRRGFNLRDSGDPSPGVRQAIDRLTSFLTLAGLTALLAGGVGVANAVSALVDRKRRVIAIYKALGAPSRLVNAAMLLQVMMLAGLGVAVGLVIGVAAPMIAGWVAGPYLPVRLEIGFHAEAVILATLYGFLTALIFILWPLGRASQIRAAELLREGGSETLRPPPRAFLLGCVASAAALIALAVFFSSDPLIAAIACAALAAAFALFWLAGDGISRLARRLPRPRRPELALALGSIARPGGLTRVISVSLGVGLTLLTAISLVGGSLSSELKSDLPERAPSHFFLSIAKRDFDAFSALIAREAPGAKLSSAPMLRGRIVELAGTPADQFKAGEDAKWVLNGDRGLTFERDLPAGSRVIEGEWWPADHKGEPLVSFEAELARALGLKIGDKITVNVLGRNITARLANFRTVEWESLDINFVMIFSPNTLENAPYSILATLEWPGAQSVDDEARVTRAVAQNFPAVTAIRVREALEAVNALLSRVLLALQAAGGVTLAAGVLVLAGALAAAQRGRVYEAVILKTLGATRRRIIAAHIAEQLALAVLIGAMATAAGAAAAYAITTFALGVPFHATLTNLLQPVAITTILVLGFGAVGISFVLRAKAASYLRTE